MTPTGGINWIFEGKKKKYLKKCEQEEAFSKDLILSPINFLNDLTSCFALSLYLYLTLWNFSIIMTDQFK